MRSGKWVNHPKTAYDLIDGELVQNSDATTVRRIFKLRAQGHSYNKIEQATGIGYSTVRSIVHSRIYLGEVGLNGEWFPGRHEPIITEAEFQAAHRDFIPGRTGRSRHVLSGRVRCGPCGRVVSVRNNGKGTTLYRCWHRGQGCRQPSRSTTGLERATLLGLHLLSEDEDLQEAIRRKLREASRAGRPTASPPGGRAAGRLEALVERRRKLLELYYAERITAELFAEQETELTRQIQNARQDRSDQWERIQEQNEVAERFEEVARVLGDLDIKEVWTEATEAERRVLVEELVERVAMFPDHLEVTIAGTPTMNVTLQEVGLTGGWSSRGVGGQTRTLTPRGAPAGEFRLAAEH